MGKLLPLPNPKRLPFPSPKSKAGTTNHKISYISLSFCLFPTLKDYLFPALKTCLFPALNAACCSRGPAALFGAGFGFGLWAVLWRLRPQSKGDGSKGDWSKGSNPMDPDSPNQFKTTKKSYSRIQNDFTNVSNTTIHVCYKMFKSYYMIKLILNVCI